MTQRFKTLFFVFGILLGSAISNPHGFCAAPSRETEQNAEAMEMIARQMRSLSQSLDQMPGPPAFDQTLQIPDPGVKIHSDLPTRDVFEDKGEDQDE